MNQKAKILDEHAKSGLFNSYRNSNKRLLLLDYDGTLVSFTTHPAGATPSARLLETLGNLCSGKNTCYIISGRNSEALDSFFGTMQMNLVAEHGARSRNHSEDWTSETLAHGNWKQDVGRIMQEFADRCENTFVEEKSFSMVWHYRKADAEQGSRVAAELFTALNEAAAHHNVHVSMGNKIVEVRNAGLYKGVATLKILKKAEYDFILAIGDDKTDEDTFGALADRENCYTIKVGPEPTSAAYFVQEQAAVITLLEELAAIR
jgi:trehalose 6-phosphate synthase/phosphatase